MRLTSRSIGAATIGSWLFVMVGCRTEVPFSLEMGLAEFEVQAGVPVTNSGTAVFDSTVTIGSGTITIEPNDITVTPADTDGGRGGRINFQDGDILEITVWIDETDAIDTVCEEGDEYGPFEVTLDEDYVPTSVSPSMATFTSKTRRLLNEGRFSLCIEIVSPVDGTVAIDELTLNLGL